MREAQIGDRVRDRITSFEGIVIGKSHWLTGCDTVGIRPEELHDGKPIEVQYFDVTRVKILNEGAIKLPIRPLAAINAGGPTEATPSQGRG